MIDPTLPGITSAVDVTQLVAGLLQFGGFGALVAWIVLKVIPSLQADNAASRAAFSEALDKQQATFVEEMRLERESHGEEMRRLTEKLEDLLVRKAS